jgi:hypothetical protein
MLLYVSADDVHFLGNCKASLLVTNMDTNREVGLEVNTERTKCMCMSYEQNVGHSHSVMIVSHLEVWHSSRYLGTILTGQNCICEDVMCRLTSGSLCHR